MDNAITTLSHDELNFTQFALSKPSVFQNFNNILEANGDSSQVWEKLALFNKSFEAESISNIAEKKRIASTLVIGCQNCLVPFYLRLNNMIRGRLIGIDSSDKAIAQAKKLAIESKVKIELHKSFLDDFSLPPFYEKFGLVICLSEGANQCQDWSIGIEQLINFLAPGGILMVSFNWKSDWAEKIITQFFQRLFYVCANSKKELVTMAFERL